MKALTATGSARRDPFRASWPGISQRDSFAYLERLPRTRAECTDTRRDNFLPAHLANCRLRREWGFEPELRQVSIRLLPFENQRVLASVS